ncbi:MAG: amino acid dehydrogenase [Pseudomonadota bacterium]
MQARELSIDGWRKVVHFEDAPSGLNAIISVHDATLGPGCGGCRMFAYENFEAALEDVKNLSRAMSYKNALGGIPFGGGKAVIIGDPKTDKSDSLFKAFGEALNMMDGLYYTAEDSGVTDADMRTVQSVSKYVGGVGVHGLGGNPAPFTARGVWRGIQAAAKHRLGAETLNGVRVSILGVGAVGFELARLLHEEGAILTVADINQQAVDEAVEQFGAVAVAPEEAVGADVDVFAPCALGGSINETTIDSLKARVVAGAANNQLKTPDMDLALKEKGILYAPDFVINAAGVISVGLEILGSWSADELTARIDKIGATLTTIFDRAKVDDRPTGAIADEMAMEIIARGPSGGRQAAE